MKTCTACGCSKALTDFGLERKGKFGRRSKCRSCRSATEHQSSEYRKAHYTQHREQTLAVNAHYRESRREVLNEAQRRRYSANPKPAKEASRLYILRRIPIDPHFRLKRNVASAVWASLRGGKQSRTFDLLGYSLDDLRRHLEHLFVSGMSWENYGQWHVDHVIPVASFSFQSASDDAFKRCWSLSNLQPLWAIDNLKKGAKVA